MKLAITFVLVALALCCSPASAEICPGFVSVIQTLFLGTAASYEAALEPFSPEADLKDAAIQLKTLVDLLPEKTKEGVVKLLVHGFLHSHCLAVDPQVPSCSFLAPFAIQRGESQCKCPRASRNKRLTLC